MMNKSKTPPTHLGSCRYLDLYRGFFGFVHHSIAILFLQVPNPNLTIRNFLHRCTPAAPPTPPRHTQHPRGTAASRRYARSGGRESAPRLSQMRRCVSVSARLEPPSPATPLAPSPAARLSTSRRPSPVPSSPRGPCWLGCTAPPPLPPPPPRPRVSAFARARCRTHRHHHHHHHHRRRRRRPFRQGSHGGEWGRAASPPPACAFQPAVSPRVN
jgi:hypothetical protein